jgi:hypothetical protein
LQVSCDAGSGLEANAPNAQRNALTCVLLFAACVLIAHPVSNEGYVDDFSYAATALQFARTGHIIFNGWASPFAGWMILWGALFIKLFGFSFFILRMAALPFALGTVYLFHRILARFGVSQRDASLGALALGLSPMFFPLTTSFMTDVPAMFVLLLCVFMCQQAASAATPRATILWLVFAALLNVSGGTVRQNAWVGALVMVPSTGWLLRKRRGVLPVALAAGAVSFIAVLGLTRWFYRRPNYFVDPATQYKHYSARIFGDSMAKILLCLLLLLLPLFAGWWPTVRSLTRLAWLRASALLVLVALIFAIQAHRGHLGSGSWLAPWLPCTVSRFGNFDADQIDQLVCSSVTFPPWLRIALSLLTIAAVWVVAEQVGGRMSRRRPVTAAASSTGEKSFLWILGPASLAYALLLVPRAASVGLLDKYLIFLMPFAIVGLLLLHRRLIGPAVPIASFVVLAIFALDAVGDTHDYYADERAGDVAIRELTTEGVPRTSISQSINSDVWQQLSVVGHIGTSPNDRGPNPPPLRRTPAVPCAVYAEHIAPLMQPEYYLVFSPSPCLQPSRFPPVSYGAWLPPFHRNVNIEQPIYTLP